MRLPVDWRTRLCGEMTAAAALPFKSVNGIRRGGRGRVPRLCRCVHTHSVYTGDLTGALRDTGTGCHSHGKCISSLSYANAMVLPAPTLGALRGLGGVREAWAARHDTVHSSSQTLPRPLLRLAAVAVHAWLALQRLGGCHGDIQGLSQARDELSAAPRRHAEDGLTGTTGNTLTASVRKATCVPRRGGRGRPDAGAG